jgi:branched-chain amino acid transport system substrate-binding protein
MGHRLAVPALVATLALAGCNAGAGPNVVQGQTLTIYAGLPLRGPSAARGQAIENGVKLALADAGGRVGGRRVEAVYIDDTRGTPPQWSQAGAAEAARTASQDITAIGYIGDVESGATRVSLPITNQAEMAQVSPASTAVDLTRAAGGQLPQRLQPSEKRTFVRVVPADDVQARAAAAWAKQLGARRIAASDDGSVFGHLVSVAFGDGARKVGLKVVPLSASPDIVYFGGTATTALAPLQRLARQLPHARFIGPDSLLDPGLLRSVTHVGLPLLITSPFLDPSQLPPAGRKLVTEYRRRFGSAPDPAAAYGYEAASLLLDAIRRAGSAGDDRLKVISALLAERDRDSVIGRYSLDSYGETTLREIAGYRVSGGKAVIAQKLIAP